MKSETRVSVKEYDEKGHPWLAVDPEELGNVWSCGQYPHLQHPKGIKRVDGGGECVFKN